MRIRYLLVAVVVAIALGLPGQARADGIDDFNASWAGRSLAAQRVLDREAPLAECNIIGTHNSFNSAAYSTATSYLDPNQIDSIFNQLRMGVRSIELDVHWTSKMEGPVSFPDRLLLCHGTSAHIGCSLNDRYFAEGLDEIAAWLGTSDSEGQVLILHIEDHMEGQHGEAFAQVSQRIGAHVYPSGGCRDIPGSLTKADVLAAGKKILIWNEGGCTGDAGWNGMVFTGLGGLSRVWEDSTTIGGIFGSGAPIGDSDVVNYFAGGTNIVDLDQLHQNDSRLLAAIWSWDAGEPNDLGGSEDCAVQHANSRWNDDGCEAQRVFACENEVTGSWAVSSLAAGWGSGALACDALGPDHRFSVPTNSRANQALAAAKSAAGRSTVWLNHDDRAAEGVWSIGTSSDVFYGAGTLGLLGGQSVSGTTRRLKMEKNCNLVLYSVDDSVIGGGLWTSNTANAGTDCRMEFQADGNLVVYDGGGQAKWASGTSGTSGAELHLQGDGNAVIYNGGGGALWQTYTNYAAEYDIGAGQFALSTGQLLHSRNRKLEMQPDCNLVMHSFENGVTGGPLWHSNTSGAGSDCRADFQSDGNLVVYDGGGQAKWASGTSGTPGARLRLQEDGNLVIYNPAAEPLWNSGTAIARESIFGAGQLLLTSGEWRQNRSRRLEMKSDCNLVLLSVENAVVGGPLWHSDTSGAGTNCYADLQPDGNFVVYDGAGEPRWSSGTSGTAGAQLRMQEDGNVVLYNGAGEPLWSTSTNVPGLSVFDAGQFLLAGGQFVQHQNRRLEMQADCNLVLYKVSNAITGAALWHSDTSLAGADCHVDLQGDGNLVVYDAGGQPKWASGTSGTTGAQLSLQPDGNLVIYNGAGLPLWTTNTAGSFSGASVCGDAICNGSETCSICPGDCGSCPAVCGDFSCDENETCSTCFEDCGTCGGAVCGDATCDAGEGCETCSADCGACSPVCGDLGCNGSETCSTCPGDCGVCSGPTCGDLTCNGSETCDSCPGDCGSCPPVCGCGDGLLQFACGETCDDGNTVAGDGCNDMCLTEPCPSTPLVGCREAAQARLQLSEKKPGYELLKMQWKKLVDSTTQSDFGDRLTGMEGVSLCVYGDAGTLVQRFAVGPDGSVCGSKPCWKTLGPKGFSYKDREATSDGIMKILLLSGAPGRGKADAMGKNNASRGQTNLPVGIVEQLTGNSAPTIQLVTEAGFCLTATMTDVRKDDGVTYQAQKK